MKNPNCYELSTRFQLVENLRVLKVGRRTTNILFVGTWRDTEMELRKHVVTKQSRIWGSRISHGRDGRIFPKSPISLEINISDELE
ncbi:hypothetical protein COOONC_21568 [Cooperia oncophora]